MHERFVFQNFGRIFSAHDSLSLLTTFERPENCEKTVFYISAF